MLSNENLEKLDVNVLYKREPKTIEQYTYWCKNWTYKARIHNDKAYMYDTYFDNWDSAVLVTDENIDDFIPVFNFNEVKRISDSEIDEYNKGDLYYVATNSGGYSCGNLHWVKKNSVKSKDLLTQKKVNEIESLKRRLEWAENDLNKLLGE